MRTRCARYNHQTRNNMNSTVESASVICAIMDAQMTDEEFDAAIARNKLLHDCKTKGFRRLQTLGPHAGGVGIKPKAQIVRVDAFEFANMGAKLVNEGKTTITAWANQCGRNPGDLRYYCDKFGIELVRKMNPDIDHDKIYEKARRLINSNGIRMNPTALRCGVSVTFLRTLFHSRGRVYNQKTIKLEKA